MPRAITRGTIIPVLLTTLLAFPSILPAQEKTRGEEQSPDAAPLTAPPIVVVNFASLDRALADIKSLFGSVKRDDLTGAVKSLLSDVGALKGLDREKPFGALIFLKPALAPQAEPVLYLPLADERQFLSALNDIPRLSVVESSEDHWKISVDGADETWFLQRSGDYLFAAQEKLALHRVFPKPAQAFADLSQQYDITIDVRQANIPLGMRAIILNLIRARANAEIRQAEGQFTGSRSLRKVRRLLLKSVSKNLITETQSMTIGFDLSQQHHQATVEIAVNARPHTDFRKALREVPERPSRFAPLLDHPAIVATSINAKLSKQTAKILDRSLAPVQGELTKAIAHLHEGEAADDSSSDEPTAEELAEQLIQPFRNLVATRNIDGFIQLRKTDQGDALLIAALKFPGAADLRAPLHTISQRLVDANPELAKGVRLKAAATIAGVTFDRLLPNGNLALGGIFFPKGESVDLGLSDQAIWLGIGGAALQPTLEDAITTAKRGFFITDSRKRPSFVFHFAAGKLFDFEQHQGEEISPIALKAFSAKNDDLLITYRPTRQGGKFRLELDEGFIRLLGLLIADGYDRKR